MNEVGIAVISAERRHCQDWFNTLDERVKQLTIDLNLAVEQREAVIERMFALDELLVPDITTGGPA